MGTIGEEVALRVFSTVRGFKVATWDGRGLADGVFVVRSRRYFYPDDYANPEQSAHDYAERQAEELGNDARVVPLGEYI